MIFLANDPQAAGRPGLDATSLPLGPMPGSPGRSAGLSASLAGGLSGRRCAARALSAPLRPAQAWPFMSRCPDRMPGRIDRLPDFS